mmetsp:Transcript_69599/g.166042  ORF Transcript_69599/g.166042 Transcript_69599/m.166042 type:complete len:240 (+) Transcript_69599:327-1046(+)
MLLVHLELLAKVFHMMEISAKLDSELLHFLSDLLAGPAKLLASLPFLLKDSSQRGLALFAFSQCLFQVSVVFLKLAAEVLHLTEPLSQICQLELQILLMPAQCFCLIALLTKALAPRGRCRVTPGRLHAGQNGPQRCQWHGSNEGSAIPNGLLRRDIIDSRDGPSSHTTWSSGGASTCSPNPGCGVCSRGQCDSLQRPGCDVRRSAQLWCPGRLPGFFQTTSHLRSPSLVALVHQGAGA